MSSLLHIAEVDGPGYKRRFYAVEEYQPGQRGSRSGSPDNWTESLAPDIYGYPCTRTGRPIPEPERFYSNAQIDAMRAQALTQYVAILAQ